MGTFHHHAIIVTSFDDNSIYMAHEAARSIVPDLVSDLSDGEWNGYRSFAVFPDGSKEGREESDERDRQREEFLSYLDGFAYETGGSPLDYVMVSFGEWATQVKSNCND